MQSRLFYLARFLDTLWWVAIFALCYDWALGQPHWETFGFLLVRWVNRGLYRLALAPREKESEEYGPR